MNQIHKGGLSSPDRETKHPAGRLDGYLGLPSTASYREYSRRRSTGQTRCMKGQRRLRTLDNPPPTTEDDADAPHINFSFLFCIDMTTTPPIEVQFILFLHCTAHHEIEGACFRRHALAFLSLARLQDCFEARVGRPSNKVYSAVECLFILAAFDSDHIGVGGVISFGESLGYLVDHHEGQFWLGQGSVEYITRRRLWCLCR